MKLRLALLVAVGMAIVGGAAAWAQTPPPVGPSQSPASTETTVSDVVVTAHRLDEARQSIQPSLGATTYSVTNATI